MRCSVDAAFHSHASLLTACRCLPTALPQTQSGQLATVIQEGRRAAALAMIKAGADVNQAQPDGTRPIHWAVYRVDHELVDALIAKKARVDVANEFGHTPLAEAVRQGDARIVKTLLGAGSGTEGANADGQTALMVAIKNGELPVFQMLIDAGAKVNVVEKVQDQTPLMWAAAATRNAAEMVKVLIAKGATVNARAKFTDWPSQITSEPRAQYHAYGGLTPLLYAARGGCYACVEALVAAGADVNLPTPEGVTPDDDGARQRPQRRREVPDGARRQSARVGRVRTDGAVHRGRQCGAPLAAVVRRGAVVADVVARRRSGRVVPAAWCSSAAVPGAAAPRSRRGAVAAARWQGGAAAVRAAVAAAVAPVARPAPRTADRRCRAMEMINLLLAAGVDTNAQLNMRRPSNQGGRFNDPLLSTGTTPLLRALINNDTDVARLLLEKGANPNIYGMGLSPWLYAAGITSGTYNATRGGGSGGGGRQRTVDTALLDLMLEHGADVNAQVTGAASYSG